MKDNIRFFYNWFIEWYIASVVNTNATIIISIPNELTKIKDSDGIIIDVFKNTNPEHLQTIIKKADEYSIKIYVHNDTINPKNWIELGFNQTNYNYILRYPYATFLSKFR